MDKHNHTPVYIAIAVSTIVIIAANFFMIQKPKIDEVGGLENYKLYLKMVKNEKYIDNVNQGIKSQIQMFEGGTTEEPQDQQKQPAQAVAPKTDKPTVDLFVMAYCPYGTQAEKGILPAVRALGDKINFKIKFVDYAMHGEKEVKENLNQYCIQKEEPAKFQTYLACLLNGTSGSDAEIADCMKSTKINTSKVDACITATDKQFDIMKQLADKTTWNGGQFPPFGVDGAENTKFGVQGSPTLVINGVQVNAGRDSASYLKAICSAFNTAPEACKTELSSTQPGPGFGFNSVGDAQAAGCSV